MDLFDIAVASKLAGGGGGGGGSSNIVWHTFTPSDANTTYEITIPYDGDGYPIEVAIFTLDGTVSSSSNYKSIQGLFVKKDDTTVAPDYTGKNHFDEATMCEIYRYNLTASGRFSASAQSNNKNFYNNGQPSTSTLSQVRMTSKNKLNMLIAEKDTTNIGIMPGVEYTCIVKYSS